MKTESEFIEALGKIVEKSDRMLLVINDMVEVHAPFFNYQDMQKLTYLLQRTSCEWWLNPNGPDSIKLRVRIFTQR